MLELRQKQENQQSPLQREIQKRFVEESFSRYSGSSGDNDTVMQPPVLYPRPRLKQWWKGKIINNMQEMIWTGNVSHFHI